jgi:copper chaperone NosL
MGITRAALGLAMLLATSCGVAADGPPEIAVDRTACSHCGMLISEPLYAAAYQAAGGETRVFDDLGCLRNAARTEHGALRVWVHDAASGAWIDGAEAIFVSSSAIRTPMGGGMLAYRHPEDADRAAVKHKAQVIRSLSTLLDTKEPGS